MVSISAFIVAASGIIGAIAVPQRGGGGGGGGGGLSYTQNWGDGTAKFNFKSSGDGFSVTWSGDKGNFVVGRGWGTGSARNVSFTGTFEPKGNAYLTIYGWTTNPLVEYYIVESYGVHKPCSDNPEAEQKANMTSDGDTYEVWTKIRKNKPSIQGTATFPQFWSIRTNKRTSGTVDTGAHFKAWTSSGLKLGRQNYMVLAVEGQDSTGSAAMTIGTTGTPAAAAAAAMRPAAEVYGATPTPS